MLWISFGLSLSSTAWSWNSYMTRRSAASTLFQHALSLIFAIWIYGKLYRGRNWARVLILVTTVLGMLSVLAPPVWKLMEALPVPSRVILLMNCIISSYALWLVFTLPGKEWFRNHSWDPVA